MSITVKKNILLKNLCTIGIGGNAQFYISVNSQEQLLEAFSFVREQGLSFFVLGKGSNCFFDDRGYVGVIIHNKINFCEFNKNKVKVGAGFSFAGLGKKTAKRNLLGLEYAACIPASVGGAVFMNAGAEKCNVSCVLESIDYITIEGEKKQYLAKDFEFDYRYSFLQKLNGAVISSTFILKHSVEAETRQKEMVLKRQKTQPLKEKNAGCVFRNPPKTFAGELIEKCGLKGKKIGDAEVSNKHANFIVNKENASSQDMLKLIDLVKKEVFQKYKIRLREEIRYVPFCEEK